MKGKVFITAVFPNEVLSLLEVTTRFAQFMVTLLSFDSRFETILYSKTKGHETIKLEQYATGESMAKKIADVVIQDQTKQIYKEDGVTLDYDYRRSLGFSFTLLTHGVTSKESNWMYFNLGGDRSPDNIGGTLVYYFDEHFEANYSYYQSLLEIIIDTFHATNAHFCQRIYFSQNKFFPVPLKHGLERIGLINYYQKGFLLPPLPDYIKLENYKDKGTLFHIDKQVTFPLYTNFADYEAGKCPQFDNFTKKIRPVFEAFRNMYPNPLSKD